MIVGLVQKFKRKLSVNSEKWRSVMSFLFKPFTQNETKTYLGRSDKNYSLTSTSLSTYWRVYDETTAPIFKNKSHQKEFTEKGFIQIPLLSETVIKELLLFLDQQKDNVVEPFHASHFSTDTKYKQVAHDIICKSVYTEIEPLLNNFIPIFGNFMVKHADINVSMPLHADWTYVNEDKYRSIAIWIPLVDTNEENGCLGVIEGSHKIMNKIRGPRIQQSSYAHDEEWAKTLGKLLPTKAGNAIVYDHALMHYSLPNKSGKIRPALNLSLVPKDTEIVHYCIPEKVNEIELYKVENSQFYIHYNNFQRPETGMLLDKMPINTIEWIDERMNAHYFH